MKIRRKLLITFLALCLIPLVFGTIYATYIANQSLTEKITDHLESVASIQKTKIQSALNKHLDRLALVASRTQLRISLDNYNSAKNISDKNRITKIIRDAKKAIPDFQNIAILDVQGNLITTAAGETNKNFVHDECIQKGKTSAGFGFLYSGPDGVLGTHLYGPLKLNDILIGVVIVDTKMPEIGSIAQDYTGLNETGETVVARRSPEGDALFISPLRFDHEAAFSRRESRNNLKLPMTQALLKHETLLTSAIDYRGEEVVAATRYIPDADWGLVVKMDKVEAYAPIRHLRNSVFLIIFLATMLVLIISYFLSHSLTSPLKLLDKAAAKLSNGDWDSRAEIRSTDEIGSLAQSFNIMAENLTSANTALEDKVAERTEELEQEVQEQIKTEEALKKSQQLYQDLVETSQDLVWQCDMEGKYIYLNPAWEEVFSYSNNEMIGKKFSDFQTPEMAERDQTEFKRLLEGNSVSGLETVHLGKNDREIHLVFNAKPIKDETGRVLGTRGTAYDITDRKKTEEELRGLTERNRALLVAVPDIIMEVDTNKVYSWANPAGYNFFGDDVLGKEASNYFEGEQETYNRVQPLFNGTSRELVYVESWQRRRDGEIRLLAWWCRSLKDADGNFIGALSSARDITEQVRDRKSLQKSEQRFRDLTENTSDWIWEVDTEGAYTYVSPRVTALTGYTPKEILGKTPFDLMSKTEAKRVSKIFSSVLKSRKPIENLENVLLHKQGGEVIVETNAIPFFDSDNNFAGYRGMDRDISERKQAKHALEHSHDLMRYVIEHNRSAVAVHDRDLRYIYVSQSYLDDFGVKEPDVIGKHHYDVFPDLPQKWRDVHQKALAGETSGADDDPYEREDGSVEWTRWECRPWYEADGTVGGIIVYTEVITERKRAEQELQNMTNEISSIFRSAPIGIGMVSDRKIQQVNDRFCEIVGYSREELEGQNARMVYPSQEIYEWVGKEKYEQISRKGTGTVETQFQRKDGAIIDVLMSSTPLDLSDLSIGVTFSALDITDRKKAEQELNTYREHLEELVEERTAQLETSNKELKEFAYVVSHDLKAPLRAISQLSYWLSKDYADVLDEEGKNQLGLLVGRVERLDALIEGILQYSRAGKISEKETQIDFNQLVPDIINMLAPPKNIRITVDKHLPIYLGDETRLGHVFQNLINNAIKFMDKPKAKIKIGCKQTPGFWQFYVSDNGPGIEEQYFERIFEIFQRLQSRDEKEGTGVGLSLVKRVVKIYGGDVWLESKVDKGTTFYFTLPVQSGKSDKKGQKDE